MNRQILIDELHRDEGLRLLVYDDANGQPIRPGSKLVGHPTIGVGRALDVHGISTAEADALLNNDIDNVLRELAVKLPWFGQAEEGPQRVLVNVAFNVGVNGLLQFHDFLAALEARAYAKAAEALTQSKLAQQAGARTERLKNLLEA